MSVIIATDERGVKVWRTDRNGFANYSVSISKKNQEGNYENCYVSVRFKKGVELENGTEILIKNAFPSFNTGNDGRKYPFWMIMDFEDMNAKVPAIGSANDFVKISEEDLEEMPFK